MIHLPGGLSPFHFLVSLAVPGFSFVVFGRQILGASFFAVWCAAGVAFVTTLGYPAASVALALLISAHAISIFNLQLHWVRESTTGFKIVLALITLAVVALAIYVPLIRYSGRHWVMPLHVRSRVVVVATGASAGSFHRGDWMAYSFSEGNEQRGVHVRRGLGLGPVLAVGGDRIEFGDGSFRVNGISHPSLPYMPAGGELVVPENHWFIWPEPDISGHAGAGIVAEALLRQAVVSPGQVVGKLFKRWFWRRQISS